jgi:integrase
MARTIKSQQLQTRSARIKLPTRHEPYWVSINRGAHFGYRKGTQGGSWFARHRKGGRYVWSQVGKADDIRDADGEEILTFEQAQETARAWFTNRAIAGTGSEEQTPYTVADAMDGYFDWADTEAKTAREMRRRSEIHILPDLGDIEVAALTRSDITKWHRKLARSAALVRSAATSKPRYRKPAATPDEKRARKVSSNKQLTLLRAALNHAFRAGLADNDKTWRSVVPFKNVEFAKTVYFTEEECMRLVNACPPDFKILVQGALHTGCRYGELAALVVSDFDPHARGITVHESKSGKPRFVALADDGQSFFVRITAGKNARDRLITKDNGNPWGKSDQRRRMIAALAAASIDKPGTFHVLRHTYASHIAMNNVPLFVIAKQLGHADTRMVEKHYGHLAPNYISDTIRRAAPRLAGEHRDNVTPLAQGNGD